MIEEEKVEEGLLGQHLEALGRLAGGVAHDFNNLLTVIHGNAAMLLDRIPSDTPEHQELEEIRRAADRASELTRQLLAFSRKQVVNPRPVNLTQTVRELERFFCRLIPDDVTLVTELEVDAAHVRADPGQLEQVLLNLVSNARDAVAAGGAVTIRVENVTLRGGEYVALTVRDDGPGIPPEVLPHIFDPFFTTKPLAVGTGLGLATVYGVVQQSGGHIRVDSEPGRGTSFHIYLPRSGAADPATKRSAEHNGRGSATVLIVEDEAPVRDLAARVLKRLGYAVLEAANGAAALDVIQSRGNEIDLALCDVVMPGITGSELARRITERLPDVKIVFMSGYTEDEILRRGLLLSEMAFIEKPFSPSQLGAAVARALRV